MVIPTLLVKGTLTTTSSKIKQESLDKFTAIHWILKLIEYKLSKKEPNIHDRLFMFQSLVGSGKTTAFIVEIFRYFFNTRKNGPEKSKEYRDPLDFDFSVYDFPDDEYTIENRKKGIVPVTKTGHVIVCAQPTVALAVSKAVEVANEPFNPDLELGFNVSYKTGPAKIYASDSSQILYCTMGTLKKMAKTKTGLEWMQQYEMIAVDECHKRSLDLDEGVAYLRDILRKNAGNPAFPLIVCMSATFDIEKYAEYFGTEVSNSIKVEGGAISREFFYLDADSTNVFADTAALIWKIHTESGKDDPDTHNDILVFVPGDPDFKKIIGPLEKLDVNKELFFTKYSSEIDRKNGPERENILYKTLAELRDETKKPNLKRRVTVATPVVETGLTVNTLKYVVDTCLVKDTAYSPVHGLSQLLTQPCSQSSLEQRGGRAGRVQFGYIYRMIREPLATKMEPYSRPDIFTADLSKVLLDMMYAGLDVESVVKPITNEMFELFVDECRDLTSFKLSNKTENCKCMYTDVQDKKSSIVKEKKFLHDIILRTHPETMLDEVPTDVYVIARNKLMSLGLYGTYIGYLASKVDRLSVETMRMVLAGAVYGVSINDLITIGIFVDTGEKRYLYDYQSVNFMSDDEKKTTKPFRFDRLIETVFKKQTLEKHFGGSSALIMNQLYDEFLEPLYIIRWYASQVRKSSPSKMIQEAKKLGINLMLIYKFMDCRNQIQESLAKVGIVSTSPEINLNSDSVFEDIIRIKKCIHAGFKNNLAYLQPDGFRYKTNTGLIISPKDMRVVPKPKKIIYGKLFMKVNPQTIFYEPQPTFICGLDGII